MKHERLEIPIDEFASPILSFATEDMTIEEMTTLMEDNRFRHLPVLKEEKPVGIISAREIKLLKNLDKHFDLRASDIMTEYPYCVPQKTSIEVVAYEMSNKKIGSALVVDDAGKVVSIFTSIDGLNALVEIVRGDIEK